ncbi:hypothetical protein ABMA28_017097 [Loxostege sticticalis]|uniref:Secreted protein n=1 Tax=Loxostege sticticalis TaxID=481309 RepID=A0ABD0T6Z8_LOXSC
MFPALSRVFWRHALATNKCHVAMSIQFNNSKARKGGGRSFQHLEAANLNDPRKAAVRWICVEKTFSYRYFGFPVLMTSNSMVARCSFMRASILSWPASLMKGVTCDRGGTLKQKRMQAFCTRCTNLTEKPRRQGPYTVSQ